MPGGGAVAAVDPELHNVFELGTKGDYLGGALKSQFISICK